MYLFSSGVLRERRLTIHLYFQRLYLDYFHKFPPYDCALLVQTGCTVLRSEASVHKRRMEKKGGVWTMTLGYISKGHSNSNTLFRSYVISEILRLFTGIISAAMTAITC